MPFFHLSVRCLQSLEVTGYKPTPSGLLIFALVHRHHRRVRGHCPVSQPLPARPLRVIESKCICERTVLYALVLSALLLPSLPEPSRACNRPGFFILKYQYLASSAPSRCAVAISGCLARASTIEPTCKSDYLFIRRYRDAFPESWSPPTSGGFGPSVPSTGL